MIKLKESTKIELLAFTGCIILALLFSTAQAISEHYSTENHIYYNNFWISLLFSHMITCIAYLILCLYVQNEMEQGDTPPSNAIILICILINVCFITEIINIYFTILLSLRMAVIYFTANKHNPGNKLHKEALALFACSIFIHASVILLNGHHYIIGFFLVITPIAILHYLYDMYMYLPSTKQKRFAWLRYIGFTILATIITYIPVFALVSIFFPNNDYSNSYNDDIMKILLIVNLPVQLILVPLFTWNVYKSRLRKNNEEILSLKTELGKSDANLNFLKSQINPHFLFNSLNTLYGTALQEKAERTGEGIQKLGDMMRFMLQENIEDKILLSRDVDYLNNYISIQKLRTSISPDIVIETQIEEQHNNLQITPMLLIPFVENAFKHGISLQYLSHIKITLQTDKNKLYFDVHNSIHVKKDNDPERLQSGIGLQNVKQRLALIYPNKHELIIRENAKEFFIHLTLQLEGNN
ncbi:sensor histidine kinase [Pedobacter frigoris]|uniref:Histidine kinase n=1 Tax=Pedobacter frigoris TaxID=2571272 RepID=A0A4U1CJU9_9SPHI|nr:histidine kinase [Pedobacter frigoris]TKC07290.1 histidine kinase [Pedobacter frigoris]